MKRTSDVTILGTVVCGVSISTTTFTLRSRTSLGSTQINNQSKASKSYRYWVMTSEKRSPTYVVYHFDTQRLSPTRVCKKWMHIGSGTLSGEGEITHCHPESHRSAAFRQPSPKKPPVYMNDTAPPHRARVVVSPT